MSASDRNVYFIQSVDGGPIKIGITSSVTKRLSELQTGNPHRLRVLLFVPESAFSELHLHEMFTDLRIPGGEWFHPGDALISFIDEQILRVCGVSKQRVSWASIRKAKKAFELEACRAFSRRVSQAEAKGLRGDAALAAASLPITDPPLPFGYHREGGTIIDEDGFIVESGHPQEGCLLVDSVPSKP